MKNTIILTVHNKESSIDKILKSLFRTISNYTIKLIIILDGCTDDTNKKVIKFLELNRVKPEVKIIFTDDIWETRANNVGLNQVNTGYATLVQDDMLIRQKNWDKKLLFNFKKSKLFAVSGRAAHEFYFNKKELKIINIFGREYPFSDKNIFARIIAKLVRILKLYWIYNYLDFYSTRLVVNRGPLILDMKKAKELNFFDEKFAPFELDDIDLCCRAFKKFGLYSAANPIFYEELNGSKKNNSYSQMISQKSISKNNKILFERHKDLASR